MIKSQHRKLFTVASLCGAAGLGILWLGLPPFGRSVMAKNAAVQARPNIVLIVLDDVGYSDLGAYGSEISTPNINSIANAGVRYRRFDTKAICSPTRASALTGRNCQTIRMGDLPSHRRRPDEQDVSSRKGEIPQNVEFLPEALRRSGYATFAIGKWHLSPEYESGKPGNDASFPLQRGFDAFYGYKWGWTDQYHPALIEGNSPVPDPYRPGYYLSSDLADHAIQMMSDSHQRQPGKPMFLYLAMPFAHAPLQAPREYIDKYVKVYERGWDVLREERLARQKKLGLLPANLQMHAREAGDPAWNSLTPQQRRVYARFMATYAAYIQYGDEQVGRVLDYLKSSGLAQNTMVVILSDNGAAGERKLGGFRDPYNDTTPMSEIDAHLDEIGGPKTKPMYQRPWAFAGDTPFRRYKVWPFLGGVRTPMMVAWPGHIPDPGAFREQWVDVIDIAPTLSEVAGAHFEDMIDGVPQIPVAGLSFLDTISSPRAPSRRNVQFFELRGNRAITTTQWRAVAFHRHGLAFEEDQWQLFDLLHDPAETTNVAAKYPAQVETMKRLWLQEAARYGDLPIREVGEEASHEFDDAFLD